MDVREIESKRRINSHLEDPHVITDSKYDNDNDNREMDDNDSHNIDNGDYNVDNDSFNVDNDDDDEIARSNSNNNFNMKILEFPQFGDDQDGRRSSHGYHGSVGGRIDVIGGGSGRGAGGRGGGVRQPSAHAKRQSFSFDYRAITGGTVDAVGTEGQGGGVRGRGRGESEGRGRGGGKEDDRVVEENRSASAGVDIVIMTDPDLKKVPEKELVGRKMNVTKGRGSESAKSVTISFAGERQEVDEGQKEKKGVKEDMIKKKKVQEKRKNDDENLSTSFQVRDKIKDVGTRRSPGRGIGGGIGGGNGGVIGGGIGSESDAENNDKTANNTAAKPRQVSVPPMKIEVTTTTTMMTTTITATTTTKPASWMQSASNPGALGTASATAAVARAETGTTVKAAAGVAAVRADAASLPAKETTGTSRQDRMWNEMTRTSTSAKSDVSYSNAAETKASASLRVANPAVGSEYQTHVCHCAVEDKDVDSEEENEGDDT